MFSGATHSSLELKSLNVIFRDRLNNYEYRDLAVDKESNVQLLSGCCLLIQTNILKKLGGLTSGSFCISRTLT